MKTKKEHKLIEFDKKHILHPYAKSNKQMHIIKSAKGVHLTLHNGKKLIDGMSSWWSAIHGYNVKALNKATKKQQKKMSHIMFGGLTHKSAIKLSKTLIGLTHTNLQHIFYSDSGSVSVEVALKMAFEYHNAKGAKTKTKILSFYKGYHGDTFGAMSVCDPITGMHSMFNDILHKNIFVSEPKCGFYDKWDDKYIADCKQKIKTHHKNIAAVIIEPIVQGAGGMRMYHPMFLKRLKQLCDKYDILLILDEIATGFGRSGKMFAYEWADISPDILCIGKALTGGYISLGATLTTNKVIKAIESNNHILMHGPTFMANPLSCAIANESIKLLIKSPWQDRVNNISKELKKQLTKCEKLDIVKEVRVLGAIGVVELNVDVDIDFFTPIFIKKGVWIRPFLNLVYIMPPYIISKKQIRILSNAIFEAIELYANKRNK